MKYLYIIMFLAASLRSPRARAQEMAQPPTITIGTHVPDLNIEKWLKQGNFTPLQKGKVYLIDLWATWCVPCIAGMPHLSSLQQKYRAQGLEVIGITSEDKYGNSLDRVMQFLQRKDSLVNYNIAWVSPSVKDSEEGIWLHPWMQMSGSGNLPTCFLVDRNGDVAYIGDPFTVDETLDHVIHNTYDLSKLKDQYLSGLRAEETLVLFNEALKNRSDSAVTYGENLLTKFSYIRPNTYLVLAWHIAHADTPVSARLSEIGYQAIVRGIELTHFNSPAFLDVLAKLYAGKKDYVSAVITQKLALALSEGSMKNNESKNLELYMQLEGQNSHY